MQHVLFSISQFQTCAKQERRKGETFWSTVSRSGGRRIIHFVAEILSKNLIYNRYQNYKFDITCTAWWNINRELRRRSRQSQTLCEEGTESGGSWADHGTAELPKDGFLACSAFLLNVAREEGRISAFSLRKTVYGKPVRIDTSGLEFQAISHYAGYGRKHGSSAW